jgi:hypothetical protein
MLPGMRTFTDVQASFTLDAPSKASPFSYLQDDAFSAILEKHQRKAVNCLIQHDLSQLDPVLGDASCEQRPSFLLDMYWKVQNHFNQRGRLQFVLKTVEGYDIAHKDDKEDTKVRILEDGLGSRKHSMPFSPSCANSSAATISNFSDSAIL